MATVAGITGSLALKWLFGWKTSVNSRTQIYGVLLGTGEKQRLVKGPEQCKVPIGIVTDAVAVNWEDAAYQACQLPWHPARPPFRN